MGKISAMHEHTNERAVYPYWTDEKSQGRDDK